MRTAYTLHLPPRIVYGRGCSFQLPQLFADSGYRSIYLLADATMLKLGMVDHVRQPLLDAGYRVAIFTEIPPEPPTTCVTAAIAAAGVAGADAPPFDLVLGLGGGSVMDVAKVVALCLGHGRPPEEFFGINRAPGRGLPTALLPTTAGTGSEVTPVSVLTDVEKQVKARTASPHILPNFAIIDPALTDAVPPKITAATGIDALVHAIEAYISRNATPYAQGLALQAAGYIARGLRRAYHDGTDHAARDSMAIGSNLAGLAFANSSCAAVHALALPLGGRFHIPHGEANANLVAATMRVNLPACRDAFTALAAAMGLRDTRPEALIDELQALKEELGIPASLTHYGVTAADLPELARHAVEIRTLMEPNPVEINETTAVAIYHSCL